MITGVGKIALPVDDQERAKEFWTTRIGFELRRDESLSPAFFNCDDIEQTYRQLSERGVEFPVPPARQHFGWWALFEDPDGTRYALGQWDRVG